MIDRSAWNTYDTDHSVPELMNVIVVALVRMFAAITDRGHNEQMPGPDTVQELT
jgi:hypothetical protein